MISVNKKLNTSSLGRIWLMVRADLVSHKIQLLFFYAIFLGILILVPRLPLLFGESYSSWLQGWAVTYRALPLQGLMGVASMIYCYTYINKRTMHSHPIVFATLPMALWEKLVGMHIFMFIVYLGSEVVLFISWAFESCFISDLPLGGNVLLWEGLKLVLGYNFIQGSVYYYYLLLFGLLVLSPLVTYLLSWFNALYIRNTFVGIVAWSFQLQVLAIMYGLLFLFIARLVGMNMESLGGDMNSVVLPIVSIATGIWWAIWAGIAGWLVYRRLRTLPY